MITTFCPIPDFIPEPQSVPFPSSFPVYIMDMLFHGVEYPFSKFRSSVPTVVSPSALFLLLFFLFLFLYLLTGRARVQKTFLTQHEHYLAPQYQSVSNIILTLNPKQSTIPATGKKYLYPSLSHNKCLSTRQEGIFEPPVSQKDA